KFLITIVKRDIQVDLLSEVYYKSEMNITNILRESFLPLKYFDDNGVEKKLKPVGKKQIDLSEVVTIVIPWKQTRMREAIVTIAREGFNYKKYKQNYNQNYYFTEMDLCYAVNGNHHIASGIIQKTGFIEADV